MVQEKQLFQNGLIAKIKDLLISETYSDSANAWNEVRQAMHYSHPRCYKRYSAKRNGLSLLSKSFRQFSHADRVGIWNIERYTQYGY